MNPRHQRVKTKDRIDTIPPQLCTRKEAAALLGVTPNKQAMSTYHKRGLRYATVILKKYGKIALYNREEVHTYAPIPPPADRIILKDLITIVAAKTNRTYTASRANEVLRRFNCNPSPLSPKHPTLTWPKEESIAILTSRATKRKKQQQ